MACWPSKMMLLTRLSINLKMKRGKPCKESMIMRKNRRRRKTDIASRPWKLDRKRKRCWRLRRRIVRKFLRAFKRKKKKIKKESKKILIESHVVSNRRQIITQTYLMIVKLNFKLKMSVLRIELKPLDSNRLSKKNKISNSIQ
jgi:hypothetical protein